MTKHSYDKEFKEQAVQYYLDNKDHMTMNVISKNLGRSSPKCWCKLNSANLSFHKLKHTGFF